jgi:UMF1 family MFS transporter
MKTMRTYLLSFFFYIMGVQTVMFMAAAFGEKELGLGMIALMVTVLALEYIGIGGAFLFALISKRIGNIRALMMAVLTWVAICVGAWFIRTPLHFYTAAFFIGLVMGGIQSLSRSTYAKMMPLTQHNAGYFSFYDVSEKIAMMCGLVTFGLVEHNTGSMRNSIIGLAISFIIGFLLLARVLRTKTASTSP